VIRGVHVLGVATILLAAVSVRATESYTARYQTLPVLDWLESRPPLAESGHVPAASDLVRGLARALPLLTITDDVRPRLTAFGPPAHSQRTMGGVRDAARIELGTPGQYRVDETPVRARLDVIVFNREARATAWSRLMAHELDVRDPESGVPQVRIAGPDEADGVWVVVPRLAGGVATVAGHRGAVGFVLQVTFAREDTTEPGDRLDLSARAETVARQAATEWSSWLTRQIT
jgi:hypothetical protein